MTLCKVRGGDPHCRSVPKLIRSSIDDEPTLPPKKRARGQLSQHNMVKPSIPTLHHTAEDVEADVIPPGETYTNNLEMLFQLNKLNGGLTDAQLSTVLCRCCSCGKVFTKHVFYTYHSHCCPS